MTDARAAAVELEALTQATPQARAATVALAALVRATPQVQAATVALEVLVPSAVASSAYSGWGIRL
jgi:hypothetical protein